MQKVPKVVKICVKVEYQQKSLKHKYNNISDKGIKKRRVMVMWPLMLKQKFNFFSFLRFRNFPNKRFNTWVKQLYWETGDINNPRKNFMLEAPQRARQSPSPSKTQQGVEKRGHPTNAHGRWSNKKITQGRISSP